MRNLDQIVDLGAFADDRFVAHCPIYDTSGTDLHTVVNPNRTNVLDFLKTALVDLYPKPSLPIFVSLPTKQFA